MLSSCQAYSTQRDPIVAIKNVDFKNIELNSDTQNPCSPDVSANSDFIGIFLETAHPIKFSNHIENELKLKLKIPQSINKILKKEKIFTDLSSYNEFKNLMLNFG